MRSFMVNFTGLIKQDRNKISRNHLLKIGYSTQDIALFIPYEYNSLIFNKLCFCQKIYKRKNCPSVRHFVSISEQFLSFSTLEFSVEYSIFDIIQNSHSSSSPLLPSMTGHARWFSSCLFPVHQHGQYINRL